jgi:hypothetical protein
MILFESEAQARVPVSPWLLFALSFFAVLGLGLTLVWLCA